MKKNKMKKILILKKLYQTQMIILIMKTKILIITIYKVIPRGRKNK